MDQEDAHDIAHAKILLVNFCGTDKRGSIQAESVLNDCGSKSQREIYLQMI
jgi:hypothetical protein